MILHVITGLPRAGSTLMCNVLNQNPRFHATTTSVLPVFVNNVVHSWSNSVEFKAMLEKDKETTEKRAKNSIKAFIDNWHSFHDKEVVFDKSRAWSSNSVLLSGLYPELKMIVIVRDLRNVFASIEKQHLKTPLFDQSRDLEQKTIYKRADVMFGPKGLIGGPIIGIEDLIRRKRNNVIWVHFEALTNDPKTMMKKIYEFLNEPYYHHDFDNIVNTAEDPDGFYLHKYPHKGEGKIRPTNPNEWQKYYTPDLANTIMKRFHNFCSFFGYK